MISLTYELIGLVIAEMILGYFLVKTLMNESSDFKPIFILFVMVGLVAIYFLI